MFWKALPEHNPGTLDSHQNTKSSADGNFSKIKYTNSHINYYYKNKDPKIVKPVGQAN
jgi:hypothetical protein